MSKTYDNVIDPIQVMDEFGADALRFTLLTSATPGNDMNLSLERVRANRNFANKIWNAARFTVTNLGKLAEEQRNRGAEGQKDRGAERQKLAVDDSLTSDPLTSDPLSLADRWIASRLNTTIAEATRLFEAYQFGEAGRQAYEFLWGDFADWYIEVAKGQLAGGGPEAAHTAGVLVSVLDQTLRLLHPFIPFVTEDIWQNLKAAAEAAQSVLGSASDRARPWPEALIVAPWPQAESVDAEAEVAFLRVQDIVRAIRNARAEYNVPPGRRTGALISAGEHRALLQGQLSVIASLASLDLAHVQLAETMEIPAKSASMVAGGVTIALPLADLVDLDAELGRLRKELANAEKMAASTAARLANPGFVNSAPAHVVEGARQQLAEWENKKAQIEERLAVLEA
jgi:valyl-tRNA synthetase